MASPHAPSARLPDDLELDLIALTVADLERSVRWYRDVVGLSVVDAATSAPAPSTGAAEGRDAVDGTDPADGSDGTVTLGAHGRAVVRLVHQPGATPAPRGATGLYHLAILLPTRAALAGFVRRLLDARTPVVGASDHHVSEAIYLEDPDGHGVEVYADRPRERWTWRGGEVAMTTEPLDLDDLLRAEVDGGAGAPAGTSLGHVHLKVRDAAEAERFYVGSVGFDRVAAFPSAAFLSVAGYHHHLGANAWESRGGGPAPVTSARLLAVRASLASADAVAALHERLGDAAEDHSRGAVSFHDPSGNLWHVHARDG